MKPHSIQTNALHNYTPPPRKYVRALRAVAWNASFIIAGLLLIAIVGEIYLRMANPFISTSIPNRFVDGVGLIRKPNAELRYANWDDDNFVISRTNSLGFLDREPVNAERAVAGCHIAFIGDSYVEAREVPIADKFHVRLEEMAARELPRLAITTQAYGTVNTGQINQLPYYAKYARRLSPKLVVLVFYVNDFVNNLTAVQSLDYAADPDRLPYMSAHRDANGHLSLRPPDPEYERFMLPKRPQRWYGRVLGRLIQVSYFAKWVDDKGLIWVDYRLRPTAAWVDMIAERPCCAWLLDVWRPGLKWSDIGRPFVLEERLSPVYEDALEYTAFGIEQFKRRAERDNARLIILSATGSMGRRGDPQFDRLSAIGEAHGIPVISNYDYIVRQGHAEADARWRFDGHWNATGHQWAAETVMEWLKANQDVCD